jgi:hypothetical protein
LALLLLHVSMPVAGTHAVTGVDFVVGPPVNGVHALAGTHAVTGVDFVVGPPVTGVHALAGTHAVAGVDFVVGPPVNGVHSLALVHAVAGTLAVAGISLLLFALLLLASLHHECCKKTILAYACSFLANARKVFLSLE